MKQIIKIFLAIIIFSSNIFAADFTVNFQAAPNSIGDNEISSISSSKISLSIFTS